LSETERIARAYEELLGARASRWDLSNPGNRAILAERRRMTVRLLDRQGWLPLGDRRVLDVGAGGGAELASFRELGASDHNLVGVDLLPGRVAAAHEAFPAIDFRVGNAERLDFAAASFDLVLAFTLFSSILDETMARNVASEIRRILRPGGGLLWYDFRYNSPSNPNVRGVQSARVRTLFPDLQGALHGVTLLPPVARRLGPLTSGLYPVFGTLPLLRSHLIGLLVKPASA
jgi:SAM-dependent methyltransferase